MQALVAHISKKVHEKPPSKAVFACLIYVLLDICSVKRFLLKKVKKGVAQFFKFPKMRASSNGDAAKTS